jgi:hypothetical protein
MVLGSVGVILCPNEESQRKSDENIDGVMELAHKECTDPTACDNPYENLDSFLLSIQG